MGTVLGGHRGRCLFSTMPGLSWHSMAGAGIIQKPLLHDLEAGVLWDCPPGSLCVASWGWGMVPTGPLKTVFQGTQAGAPWC